MSIHFKGTCTVVNDIICRVPCETKWKSKQPKLVMQGWCKGIRFDNYKNLAVIE